MSIFILIEVGFLGITLGQVILSKAGRDAGKKFIIVGIIDKSWVLVADGDLRRIEKPKKKRLKHIELTEEILPSLSEKLRNELKVTNSEIRKSLAALKGMKEEIDK